MLNVPGIRVDNEGQINILEFVDIMWGPEPEHEQQ